MTRWWFLFSVVAACIAYLCYPPMAPSWLLASAVFVAAMLMGMAMSPEAENKP